MKTMLKFLVLQCCAYAAVAYDRRAEADSLSLLERYHRKASHLYNDVTLKAWAYSTNITDHNNKLREEASLGLSQYQTEMYEESKPFREADLSPPTKRLLKMAFPAQLEEADQKNLTRVLGDMSRIYATGTVCVKPEVCLNLEPGLTQIMSSSRNYSKLSSVWKAWRTNVSRKLRPHYLQYVDLVNKQAQLNGYSDNGDYLRMKYETADFEQDMLDLYAELDYLYRLVHSYVRKKLHQVYKDKIDLKGPLPACVLGDMWGRFWTNMYSFLVPYPDQPDLDVTDEMVRQNYNVSHMFKMGDEFFTSMGMKPLVDTFWNNSMLERPESRSVVCHASAWDFYDGEDFRIKMCTEVNFENFETIHHELGHVQYFMQYAHLPLTYRSGANDGFHEAIGELMSISMTTQKHLTAIGLLKSVPENMELDINFLLRTALKTVTTLPFHLVNDLWRWRLYRGEYDLSDLNSEFWKLKEKYLGVKSPVPRMEEDLDPPSLFHIANNYDMIRYFTRTVLQFQFLEKLCDAAGHKGPLYTCDFYGSKEAGKLLGKMLSLGASKPWQDALEVMTGERRMSARALLHYFRPLQKWLERDNILNEDGVGWGDSWRLLDLNGGRMTSSTPLSVALAALVALLLWHWQ